MQERTKETLKILLRVLVALALFAAAVLNYDKLKNIDVRALVAGSSSIAIAVFSIWGVYLIKSVLFIIPASLIYIAVGMAFSPLQAVLINAAGILLEVTLTYWLGRFLGGDYVERLLSKSKGGQKVLAMDVQNKFPALLGIRVLPVFPIDFVSLLWGASGCGFLKYLAASLLGILPRVALFTVLGDGIYDYIPIHLLIQIVIYAIPVGVAAYLIYIFVKRRREKR